MAWRIHPPAPGIPAPSPIGTIAHMTLHPAGIGGPQCNDFADA